MAWEIMGFRFTSESPLDGSSQAMKNQLSIFPPGRISSCSDPSLLESLEEDAQDREE